MFFLSFAIGLLVLDVALLPMPTFQEIGINLGITIAFLSLVAQRNRRG